MSNHGESIKSCWKRRIPPLKAEPQTGSPAGLDLLGEMEPWLCIILAALCFGRYRPVTHDHGHIRGHSRVSHVETLSQSMGHPH